MPLDTILFLRLRDAQGPLDFDLNVLATTAQGVINRTEPRVVVENPISERDERALGTEHWLARFTEGDSWLTGCNVEELDDVAELLRRCDGLVRGLVIFDPTVPASSNVAVTLAGRERLAVTGPDGFAWLQERGVNLSAVHDLRGRFANKREAYDWMIANQIKGRSDVTMLSNVLDAFCRAGGGGEDGMEIDGLDYTVANAGVAFDLDPWPDEIPVDDPQQPLGSDQERWHALFTAASKARAGESPLEVTGFPPWKVKYSDHANAGGKRRPHETEWEAVWRLTPHGAFLNPLFAPNMSFHRWAPLPTVMEQPDPGPPPPLENKTYVCLHLGDFDGSYGLYRRFPKLWSDARRGELPLNWGINPNLARNYPDIIADAYATRSPNDHFSADAGAAGYVNPNRLLAAQEAGTMPVSALDLWRRFCRHWYRRLGYTLSPMVLDQHHPMPQVLDAFQEFSPKGVAYLIENRHGEDVARLEHRLWRDMPVARLEDMSYAKSDEEMADWMLRYAEGDSMDTPAFHIYRFEWKAPSLIFDTFREAQRRAQDRGRSREWVAVHPRHWFQLLRQHLSGE